MKLFSWNKTFFIIYLLGICNILGFSHASADESTNYIVEGTNFNEMQVAKLEPVKKGHFPMKKEINLKQHQIKITTDEILNNFKNSLKKNEWLERDATNFLSKNKIFNASKLLTKKQQDFSYNANNSSGNDPNGIYTRPQILLNLPF